MAGKSGLNITKAEDPALFAGHYDAAWLSPILAEFGPDQVQAWCQSLDQPTFTGSSGRVFPKAMKASPLLRAWLARLARQNVELRTRWRWVGWQDGAFAFDTPDGSPNAEPRCHRFGVGWRKLAAVGV